MCSNSKLEMKKWTFSEKVILLHYKFVAHIYWLSYRLCNAYVSRPIQNPFHIGLLANTYHYLELYNEVQCDPVTQGLSKIQQDDVETSKLT